MHGRVVFTTRCDYMKKWSVHKTTRTKPCAPRIAPRVRFSLWDFVALMPLMLVSHFVHSSALTCSLLVLPLGVPPMPAPACFTQCVSQDSEVWMVLTTDVGNVT